MQLRPDGRLLRHDGLQDGDRVRRADLIKTPAHERTAVPSREHCPGFSLRGPSTFPPCRHAHTPCGTSGSSTAAIPRSGLPRGVPPDDSRTPPRAPRQARRTDTRRAPGRGACRQWSAAGRSGGSACRARRQGRASAVAVPSDCKVPICLALRRPAIRDLEAVERTPTDREHARPRTLALIAY